MFFFRLSIGFENVFAPPRTNTGGGADKEKAGTAHFAAGRPDQSFRKAWLLLFGAGPPPQEQRFEERMCRQVKLKGETYSKEDRSPINEQSFHEIVALLSEILVLDFQQHRLISVGSPPLGSRKDNPNPR
jgi:hypothetical protein